MPTSFDAHELVSPTPNRRPLVPLRYCQFLLGIVFVSFLLQFSNAPPRDDTYDAPWLELKDNLESASANRASKQLVSVTIGLVPTHPSQRRNILLPRQR